MKKTYMLDWAPKAPTHQAQEEGDITIVEPLSQPVAVRPAKGSFAAFMTFREDDDDDEPDQVVAADPLVPPAPVDEVELYMALPQEPYTHPKTGKDTDILQWWRDHERDLPNLARMARQFLALPASSAGGPRG